MIGSPSTKCANAISLFNRTLHLARLTTIFQPGIPKHVFILQTDDGFVTLSELMWLVVGGHVGSSGNGTIPGQVTLRLREANIKTYVTPTNDSVILLHWNLTKLLSFFNYTITFQSEILFLKKGRLKHYLCS